MREKEPFLPSKPSELFRRAAKDVQYAAENKVRLDMATWYLPAKYDHEADSPEDEETSPCAACLAGAVLLGRMKKIPRRHREYEAEITKIEMEVTPTIVKAVRKLFNNYRQQNNASARDALEVLYPVLQMHPAYVVEKALLPEYWYDSTLTSEGVENLISDLEQTAEKLEKLGL